ncbi:MAG: response regulator [Desulfobacterales bacterium]|nr:response regulator [Desulfobacterales bacterium]
MKIMVVDDELLSVELLKEVLKEMGYDVVVFSNGLDALSFLKNNGECRIVITDWEMPDMDGLELCRQIRDWSRGSYIYIIMLTSRGGTASVVEGLEAGADDFMSKPFHPAELAVRIQSARRVMSLEASNMALFALARLAERREPGTHGHLERVRDMSQELAKMVMERKLFGGRVGDDFVEDIYLAAPLHDIGMLQVPEHIITQVGSLSEAQQKEMQEHTLLGAKALGDVVEDALEVGFLKMARDIILCHHERFDGSGYPKGIAGDRIPLAARIVGIADAYSALLSPRSYRHALTPQEAFATIEQGGGSQFDSRLVTLFSELAND